MRKLIERSVPQGTGKEVIDQVHGTFYQYYLRHSADKTKPYPGISALLEDLKQSGLQMAVVSSKADDAVKDLCEQYFPGIFAVCIGDQKGLARKPDPAPVQKVLEILQIPKENSLYIGDSEVDIQTARNSEMDCISVAWGFRTPEELLAAGAGSIISRPEELLSLMGDSFCSPADQERQESDGSSEEILQ